MQFNRTGRGSVCSQAIMLVTDGATEMYDDVFEKYNWPERKVCFSLFQFSFFFSVSVLHHCSLLYMSLFLSICMLCSLSYELVFTLTPGGDPILVF